MFTKISTTVRGSEVIGSYRYDVSYDVVNATASNITIDITELDETGTTDKESIGEIVIKDNIQLTLVKSADLQTQVANIATIISDIDTMIME